MFNKPLAYFISVRTYGTWLPGDQRGSVDRQHHNQFGTPLIAPKIAFEDAQAALLRHAPTLFADAHRIIVESTIREVCVHRHWTLHAVNVRTNHAHLVATAPDHAPEAVMNTLKSWSTRRLREAGLIEPDHRVWSRHGSTIYLFKPEKMAEKIRYVCEAQ